MGWQPVTRSPRTTSEVSPSRALTLTLAVIHAICMFLIGFNAVERVHTANLCLGYLDTIRRCLPMRFLAIDFWFLARRRLGKPRCGQSCQHMEGVAGCLGCKVICQVSGASELPCSVGARVCATTPRAPFKYLTAPCHVSPRLARHCNRNEVST